MIPIHIRAHRHDTNAFVTTETINPLATKLIGIVGDRRMTKTHRYLGDHGGTPQVFAGLRLERGGISGPVNHRPGESVGIHLASRSRGLEGIGFSIHIPGEDESEVARRYQHPEDEWMGQRRNITYVELTGWPGSPRRDDSIRIEYWNEYGVGQETIVVFDDVDMLNELFWDVTGSKERQVCMWDEFCIVHEQHYADPDHERGGKCDPQPPTMAQNLAVLAKLAAQNGS